MRSLVIWSAVLMLFAVACAKSESPTVSQPSPSASAMQVTSSPAASAMASVAGLSGKVNNHGAKTVAGATFSLTLKQDNDPGDFYFEPTVITATKGSTGTITLMNVGHVPHNLSITSLGIDKTLQPGASATLTVHLGSGPNVPFFCSIHKSLGMQGIFKLQ